MNAAQQQPEDPEPQRNGRLQWDDSRMPWPKDYFSIQPGDVFRRKPAQFAKIAPPEDHSQAD
jgi:hypothetical protein